MRKYRTATAWAKEVPGMRIYILMTPQGKVLMHHVSEPFPKGRFALLGVWE